MVSYALKNNPFTRVASLPRRPRGERKLLVDDVYPQIFDAILNSASLPAAASPKTAWGRPSASAAA